MVVDAYDDPRATLAACRTQYGLVACAGEVSLHLDVASGGVGRR